MTATTVADSVSVRTGIVVRAVIKAGCGMRNIVGSILQPDVLIVDVDVIGANLKSTIKLFMERHKQLAEPLQSVPPELKRDCDFVLAVAKLRDANALVIAAPDWQVDRSCDT
jgi:hypothetical protein